MIPGAEDTARSRHCEPWKQNSWSWARNSQENRPFLTVRGVGTRSPTWTIAGSWEKALNLHPSKCQVPNHNWVDWWDACALSRHCEPYKQAKLLEPASQENRLFLTASGVGTQVPPGPLLFHEIRPGICTPANARYSITAVWTSGAGGRQMEN